MRVERVKYELCMCESARVSSASELHRTRTNGRGVVVVCEVSRLYLYTHTAFPISRTSVSKTSWLGCGGELRSGPKPPSHCSHLYGRCGSSSATLAASTRRPRTHAHSTHTHTGWQHSPLSALSVARTVRSPLSALSAECIGSAGTLCVRHGVARLPVGPSA